MLDKYSSKFIRKIIKGSVFVFAIPIISACTPVSKIGTVDYNNPIIISSSMVVPSLGVELLGKKIPSSVNGVGGCFAGQFEDQSWGRVVAESTILISAHASFEEGSNYSELFSGSGTVIRDSGDASNPRNRILSVDHVVEDVIGTGSAMVYTSSGIPIGQAYIVQRGKPTTSLATDGTTIPAGDEIVLGISNFVPGGEKAYNAIRGVELAQVQPSRVLAGLVSSPGGTEHGTSGGPWIPSSGPYKGKIQGMLARAQSALADKSTGQPTVVRKMITGGDPSGNHGARRSINVPSKTQSYIEPIMDPSILAALGGAGIRVSVNSSENSKKSGEIYGYPLGSACVVYKAELGKSGW